MGGEGVVSQEVEFSKDHSVSEDLGFLAIVPASVEVTPEPEPMKPFLAIRAKNDVWMKVTVGDKVLFSKTLKAGSEVSWDLPASARVTYGRPSAALVTLNGKELGEPNPKGAKKSETHLYLPDGTYKKVN